MKTKEKQKIMQKKPKEIEALIVKKREEIMQKTLRMRDEKNTNSIRNLKRELAILLTARQEQQIVEGADTGGGTHV